MAPPKVVVSDDLPPGEERRMWSPTAATLIYGEQDAVLVDPLLTIDESRALADWVVAMGKNVTTPSRKRRTSTQLALVAAGVGVALIPELGCVGVPEEVMLCRLTEPVHRHLHLAARRNWHADPGLARLADMLGRAASATVSSTQ